MTFGLEIKINKYDTKDHHFDELPNWTQKYWNKELIGLFNWLIDVNTAFVLKKDKLDNRTVYVRKAMHFEFEKIPKTSQRHHHQPPQKQMQEWRYSEYLKDIGQTTRWKPLIISKHLKADWNHKEWTTGVLEQRLKFKNCVWRKQWSFF